MLLGVIGTRRKVCGEQHPFDQGPLMSHDHLLALAAMSTSRNQYTALPHRRKVAGCRVSASSSRACHLARASYVPRHASRPDASRQDEKP